MYKILMVSIIFTVSILSIDCALATNNQQTVDFTIEPSEKKQSTANGETKGISTFLLAESRSSNRTSTGLLALNDNEFSKAASEFLIGFEKGEVDAAFYLGRMYESGWGVKVDVKKALEIYNLGANKGSNLALNRLGVMYFEGIGVSKNDAKGAQLICRAADNGEINAQFNCGALYLKGNGVAPDISKAMSYFQKAAESNHLASRNFIGHAFLTGNGVQKNTNMAIEQFTKTADVGNIIGIMNLAKHYADEKEEGHKDLILSYMYYNIAVFLGHAMAEQSRNKLESYMTENQVIQAKKLTNEWTTTRLRRSAPSLFE